MRKLVTKPKGIEEVQKRIRTALYQLKVIPLFTGEVFFYHNVAFRLPPNPATPKEVVRFWQPDLDRKRRKLSQRVHRFYRRSGRISLVCNLLRRSPIFLRDKWINDVILELRRTVCFHPNRTRREEALRSLKELSEATYSENLPSGQPHRKKKWQRLSARRPRRTLWKDTVLLGRYGQYLEIGICLLAGKELTRLHRIRDGKSPTDPETLQDYASMFGVPLDWIRTAWGTRHTKASEWALGRMAADDKCTPDGIRRRLEDAKAHQRAEFPITKRVSEAQEWLRKDRERRRQKT